MKIYKINEPVFETTVVIAIGSSKGFCKYMKKVWGITTEYSYSRGELFTLQVRKNVASGEFIMWLNTSSPGGLTFDTFIHELTHLTDRAMEWAGMDGAKHTEARASYAAYIFREFQDKLGKMKIFASKE